MINPTIPKIKERITPTAAIKSAVRPPNPIGGNKISFNKEKITIITNRVIVKLNNFKPYFFFFSNFLSLIRFIKKYNDKISNGRGIALPNTSKISRILPTKKNK